MSEQSARNPRFGCPIASSRGFGLLAGLQSWRRSALTIAAPHDESDLGDGGPPHHWGAVIGFHLLAAARSPIAVGGADRRSDDDLDVRAQPPGLGGQILNLLARAGAGGEQHDTMAHDREVPTHASASINASEESSSPRPLANGLKAQARQALISIRRSA
jgi:hypothetical protein